MSDGKQVHQSARCSGRGQREHLAAHLLWREKHTLNRDTQRERNEQEGGNSAGGEENPTVLSSNLVRTCKKISVTSQNT